MNTDRIDFISAYCDRWCERCAFTARCSSFACHIAIAMCGDVAEGIELAVGVPQPVGGPREPTVGEKLLSEMPALSQEEIDEYSRAEGDRRVRVDAAPLTLKARTYMMRATGWLDEHRERLGATADAVVRDALEIVEWDAYLIGAKLHRALSGRVRLRDDDDESDDHPIQNDSNGSAKVALLSLERSEAAWQIIALASGDTGASVLAGAAAVLRHAVLDEFTDAMAFIRPGFDEIPDER